MSEQPQLSVSVPQGGGMPFYLIPVICLLVVIAVIFNRNNLVSTSLAVETNPSGASVFINGKLAGATPVDLNGLSAGQYCVRIEKDGFATLTRSIELTAAGLQMKESLQPRGVGGLTVDIKPYGAEVLLDGEFLGQTPISRSNIPVGIHEIMIRKTNFKPYVQRIEVTSDTALEFREFALEDMILTMLRSQVDGDRQRVSHYMDLGHYLFVNDQLDESAEMYAKALAVANTPIQFAQEVNAEERRLEMRLRAEDLNRLNEEIRKKSHWPGKDVRKWAQILKQQQEAVAGNNIAEWQTVREQVDNFVRDGNFQRAERLIQDHIVAAKNNPQVSQAYISLLTLRLKLHNLDNIRETYAKFDEQFGAQPALARQAANAIYSTQANFQGEQRTEILGMAEKLLRKGVAASKRGEPELCALCKFELANVMTLQHRGDQAVPLYRESITGTRDATTKDLRAQKLYDCLKAIGNLTEARDVLTTLSASATPDIATRAQAELKQLEKQIEKLEPSPKIEPKP
jgi:hypothetical protein